MSFDRDGPPLAIGGGCPSLADSGGDDAELHSSRTRSRTAVPWLFINLRPYLGNIFLSFFKLHHFFNYMAVILATYKKDYSNYILDLRIGINLNRDIGTDI